MTSHDAANGSLLDAHAAWDAGRLKDACRLFRQAAEAGSTHAMLNLGFFHDTGIGTRRNRTEAMRWYKRAYRRGDMCAASNIAVLYREQGRARLMFAWYRRAAELGDGDAQVDLARCLIGGVGVRRSLPEAKRCLRKALSSRSITPQGREDAVALFDSLSRAIQTTA